jgi:hypothetical protein
MFKSNSMSAGYMQSDRIFVYARGTGNNYYYMARAGSSGTWEPTAHPGIFVGNFSSPPVAISMPPGDPAGISVFGYGADGKLYFANGGASGDPVSLGGQFKGVPAVVSWGADRIDIFGLGTDDQLYHLYWDGNKWGPSIGPQCLGGKWISSPTAVCWGPNRIDIFGLGTDRALYHLYWDGSKWGPSIGPERLGGAFKGVPSAVSWGPNRLDIFGLGIDNQMYHIYWDSVTAKWAPSIGPEGLGGTFNSSPSAISWGPGRLDVFALGIDNTMFHKWWDIATEVWEPSATTWEPLSGNFHSAPAVISTGPQQLDVFALGRDNGFWHKQMNQGAWVNPGPPGWEGIGGTYYPALTPTNYCVIPIIWGTLFPAGVQNNWGGLQPYTSQQFFNELSAIFGTTYFSDLVQYGIPQVSLEGMVFPTDPLPAAQGKYTAVFTVDDVVAMLKNNFANGTLPLPDQVKDGTPVYVVVLPSGSTIDVTGAGGAHYYLPYPSPGETSTGSQLVLWAWVYGGASIDTVTMAATHEMLEAMGADTSSPGELCDACLVTNPSGAPGPGGVAISTYFDAATNGCVAPPNFP